MEGECPKQKIRGTKNYFLFHAYLLKLPSPLKQCKLHTWFTSDQVVVTQCECERCREVSLSVDGGRPWGREGILAFPCLCAFQKFLLASFLFFEERSRRRKLHFTSVQPKTRKLYTQCVWDHVGLVCRPPGHKCSHSPTDAENFHSGR